ncbi:MAG: LexA family transcriptional regulator [Magnetococcales bacterium]|nr:LexA family transcriptional regulator [Magnetococcales bacterium]MBF0151196.1 LexA family transcriptional regulator [Magnetococcales bacterium]MBF0632387.1 LexA family transcriptional regulator [Magnetococcales bacterium]
MSPINRDIDHLNKLRDYYAKHRVLPSYNRIGTIVGFSTKSAVSKLLRRLEKAGYIEYIPDGEWSPTIRFFERPLTEIAVLAGLPESVLDATDNPILIDSILVKSPSRTVLLPVKGDSMQGAGIHEGDWVVVERCSSAADGTLVVAEVDGAFTLKTLVSEHGEWTLHPANPSYPILRPKQSLNIFGIVVGLIRKYGTAS